MKSIVLAAAASLAATVLANPLWEADFREGGNVVYNRGNRQRPSADGKSVYFPGDRGHVEVKSFPPFSGPVRMSFKARYFRQVKKNPLQLLEMKTTSGVSFFYIGRTGMLAHHVRGALGGNISGHYKTFGPSGFKLDEKNPEWHVYTFDFGENSFATRMDATVVDSGDMAIGHPASFSFHGGFGFEMKDFRIEQIPPQPEPQYRERPSFALERAEVPFRGQQLISVDKPLNATAGGVLFWARPWTFVTLLDAEKRMVAQFDAGAGCEMKAQVVVGAATNLYARAIDRSGNRADDAWHYAFTWNDRGQARLFLNGLPYNTGFDSSAPRPLPMDGNRLGDVKWIRLSGNTNCVEKFVLYDRPVSNRDVLAHYRERAPVDLVLDNSVVPSGAPAEVSLTVAPGGAYMLPNPVEPAELVKAAVDLELRTERIMLERGDKDHPRRVTQRRFELVGEPKRYENLHVDRTLTVKSAPATFARGSYRLNVTMKRRAPGAVAYTRSLYFSAADPAPAKQPATADKWKPVETLFEREFKTDADFDKVEDGPRYYQVIKVPQSAIGKPCLLSVTWPDDAPRSFGLYLYPEDGCGNRDRLQGGIQAGHEARNSGKPQTAEYLVYPAREHSLLEVRTLVGGWDAKVSKVKLERLAEPLPRLVLNLPEGLPGRKFGNTDEDQTFYNNFNFDIDSSVAGITDRVAAYLDYTGQNRFHYSVARYQYTLGPVEGSNGTGMYPARQGELGFAVDRFAEAGVGFVGKIALLSTPLFTHLKLIDCDYRRRGYVTVDREGLDIQRFGGGGIQPNPANPEVWKLFFAYFDGAIAPHARSFGDFWYDFGWGFGAWESLKHGYDDWTVAAFVRERGKGLGADDELKRLAQQAKDQGAYVARWNALGSTNAAAKVRAAWLRWRADRVTDFARALVAHCRGRNPQLSVLAAVPDDEGAYERQGIDLEALAKIDGLKLAIGTMPTHPRFAMHRNTRKASAAGIATLDADLAKMRGRWRDGLRRFRGLCGSVQLAAVNGTYFETPGSPPKEVAGRKFGCVFQDADVKYHGRHFLKEFAEAVGHGDAQEIVTGGQPVGTLGSEDAVREFVRAYRALPALDFEDIPEYPDRDGAAVVGRRRRTKNGEYFYFVNLTDCPQTVKAPYWRSRDLSSGETGFNRTVELKPYELRSFLKAK